MFNPYFDSYSIVELKIQDRKPIFKKPINETKFYLCNKKGILAPQDIVIVENFEMERETYPSDKKFFRVNHNIW